jgi:hypothetical protein
MLIIIIIIVVFHLLMLVLALGIATRIVPANQVSNVLGYVHNTIGITTPAPEQVRMIALIWIGSVIIIVDGCLFLLVLITRLSKAG